MQSESREETITTTASVVNSGTKGGTKTKKKKIDRGRSWQRCLAKPYAAHKEDQEKQKEWAWEGEHFRGKCIRTNRVAEGQVWALAILIQ